MSKNLPLFFVPLYKEELGASECDPEITAITSS